MGLRSIYLIPAVLSWLIVCPLQETVADNVRNSLQLPQTDHSQRISAHPPQAALPTNTAVADLRSGAACVALFAGMGMGHEVKMRTSGKGATKQTRFYFHGVEVQTFPTLVEVSINLVADCKRNASGISFVWPEFSKHLNFVFHWDLDSKDRETRREIEPTKEIEHDSVWQEGSSTRDLTFTLPAEGIPLHTRLIVEVSSENRLVGTFALHF